LSWFLPKLAESAKVRGAALCAANAVADSVAISSALLRTVEDDMLPALHRHRLLALLATDPHVTIGPIRIRKQFVLADWVYEALAQGPLRDPTAARFFQIVLRRDTAGVDWLLQCAQAWVPPRDRASDLGRERTRRTFEDMLQRLVREGFWNAPSAFGQVAVGPTLPPIPDGIAAAYFIDLNRSPVEDLARLPGVTKALAQAIVARRPIESLDALATLPRWTEAKAIALRPWIVGLPLGPAAPADPSPRVQALLEFATAVWLLGDGESFAFDHARRALALDPTLAANPPAYFASVRDPGQVRALLDHAREK